MKYRTLTLLIALNSFPALSTTNQEIQNLQAQAAKLQQQIIQLQQTLQKEKIHNSPLQMPKKNSAAKSKAVFHDTTLSVHTPERLPEDHGAGPMLFPTALVADNHIITYIAGTPIVTSPYTGDRPAFDGSDYIVNISSINRDIRLMEQRRRFYHTYETLGYPAPNVPIIAISGKAEPVVSFDNPYIGNARNDITLGSSELDVAAILNKSVEAFISMAYDDTPPAVGPAVNNSAFRLNMGFVNIGNLDKTPFYFTAGQLFAPFGRYSSSMISSPLTMILARTKVRPFILGYKSPSSSGPYAAAYGFMSETTLNNADMGGINVGYIFSRPNLFADVGAGLIGSLADSQGMQLNGSPPLTTFAGFASPTNGNEAINAIPGINIHGNISIDRYSFTAEWVGASRHFKSQDLSFNGQGAKPQAAQVEAGITFKAFDKPASFALGYQWSKETLALNIPKNRISGVFNISLWKDTVESIEYRHDTDFNSNTYANGASAPGLTNVNTVGTGSSSDTVVAQIGVYF